MQLPDRINVYGIKFSETNFEETLEIINLYNYRDPTYICFPSTNIVSKAYWNNEFQLILNSALLTIPDGKITEVYCRLKGSKKIQTTSGLDLLTELLHSDLTHYFYGTTDSVLEKIKSRIERDFSKAKVLGYKAPPFVSKNEIHGNLDISKDIDEINKLKPDLIWIGISNIKQDYLMHHFHSNMDQGIMLGVGAVFLYFSGLVKPGPKWLKRMGLRWLFRILQEPKKEFKKTVPSTLFFVLLVIWELISSPIRMVRRLLSK